jgi:DNA polymerase III subunit gamma/tau
MCREYGMVFEWSVERQLDNQARRYRVMAYEVTARRWRPQEFDSVVGQDHVTTTLKNAIQASQIAHAYLFAGPRGVGKTTTARILAKALNCVNGPTVSPCNICSFCNEIAEGRSVDVLEIDGASNNKVEQIRTQLLESVKYTPSQGKHKIYIIDEVHMLTKEAFNALLKTLEEPPPHVYFIFATTDPQKVLPTILSRCQRFDFRRIFGQTIVNHLHMIAEKSSFTIDPDALAIIARRADGSMRDAESLFDQVVAFGGPDLSAREVSQVLGLVEQDIYFELVDIIAEHNIPAGLDLVHNILHQGYNLDEVTLGIIEHLRNLLIVKAAPDATEILDTAAMDLERYRTQCERFQTEDLLRLTQLATQMEQAIKTSALPKVQLETGLVRMIRMEPSVLLSDILARLSDMAARLDHGDGPDDPSTQAPISTTKTEPEAKKRSIPPADAPTRMAPERPKPAPCSTGTGSPSTPIPDTVQETKVSSQSESVVPTEKTSTSDKVTSSALSVPEYSEPVIQEATSDVSSEAGSKKTLEEVIQCWPDVLERITQQRISLGNFLAAAIITDYQSHTITLMFSTKHMFHKQQAEKKESKDLIQEIFSDLLGVLTKVICEATDKMPAGEAHQSLLPKEPLPEINAHTVARQDPAVKRILDEFDGQIIGK